jgi:hypothetical protein
VGPGNVEQILAELGRDEEDTVFEGACADAGVSAFERRGHFLVLIGRRDV